MYQRSRHIVDFCIAGFRYWDGAEVAGELQIGDSLELLLEAGNPFDEYAVALLFRDKKVGYIPRAINESISQMLYFGHHIYEAVISQIDLTADPSRQVRVAVKVKDLRVDDPQG